MLNRLGRDFLSITIFWRFRCRVKLSRIFHGISKWPGLQL